MCGITGFLDFNKRDYNFSQILHNMTEKIAHRGPNDSGYWIDENQGCALGHRRLSIVDLSSSGHQPMISPSGRFVVIFNGEIYNFQELSKDLESKGVVFKSHSDTEVICAAFDTWGLFSTLSLLNGMFSIAVFDQKDKILTLIRDRLGVKPLYYSQVNGVFLFASEIKSLKEHPHFNSEMSLEGTTAYFRYGFIPDPLSIYSYVRKLEPGTLLQVSVQGQVRTQKFWDLKIVAAKGRDYRSKHNLTFEEALDHTHNLLKDAVQKRMISDVPLGSFLSGGIDSSLITALMQSLSSDPIQTFSIGFYEKGYNEAGMAEKIAAHLGTNHTSYYMSGQEGLAAAKALPYFYDEPFADSSALATYHLSQNVKKNVSVVLTGDGGDEVFQGYHRHIWIQKLYKKWFNKSLFYRQTLSSGLNFLSKDVIHSLSLLLPRSIRPFQIQEKALKLSRILPMNDVGQIYQNLLSLFQDPHEFMKETHDHTINIPHNFKNVGELYQALDTLFYLPGDILTKVDRATMAFALEARSPFLDYRLVEWSWMLDPHFKNHRGKGKYILRKLLEQYIPKKLYDRPKSGFGIPLNSWLNHDMKEWAESHLSHSSLKSSGLIDPDAVYDLWLQFKKGKGQLHHKIWSILMFQAWFKENQS
jgi:asparagine synthase (glutamine-hydrolysing)